MQKNDGAQPVCAEPTFFSKLIRFLGEHRVSVIVLTLVAAAVIVFAAVLFNPSPDCHVLVVTSAFEPDNTFRKDMTKAFSGYTPDINRDGAQTARLETVYGYRGGNSYVSEQKRASEQQRLQELLAGETVYLFLADEKNALWLVENGYAEPPVSATLPGINLSDTRFLTDSDALFEFMEENSDYYNLLSGYRLMLAIQPERTGYESDEAYQKAARQYAAAFGVIDALRNGKKAADNTWEMLFSK